MTEPNTPPSPEPVNAARLRRATLIALAVAALLLVVAVLPAEYGVDPTGLGRPLGLTEMGEIKMSLAREAAAAEPAPIETSAAPADVTAPDTLWRDVTVVPLAPGEGKEVKLVMPKGTSAEYAWSATGGVVNFDMHGDSTNAPRSYVPYTKGTAVAADSGVLTAAMDGAHGWFWRNRRQAPVSVTLRTQGAYTELKKMY